MKKLNILGVELLFNPKAKKGTIFFYRARPKSWFFSERKKIYRGLGKALFIQLFRGCSVLHL